MLYADGIHDDTKALQELLDGRGTITLSRGVYKVSAPLKIHDNTCLSLAPDAEIFLADGANCAVIENDSLPHKGALVNHNITIRGGVWNGNNANQQRRKREEWRALTHFEDDFYFGIFMRFVGVENLTVENLTVKDPESYAMLICAAENFTVQHIKFDYNMLRLNMDGVHIQGPSRFGHIRDIKGATSDDMVALNCDDIFACEITRGDISEVSIDGLYCENGYTAVRLLSCGSQMRNISIRNVFGTYRVNGISFTHHNVHPGAPVWFDNIQLDGIFASKSMEALEEEKAHAIVWFAPGIRCGSVSVSNVFRSETFESQAPTVWLEGDVQIDKLNLHNIVHRVNGKRKNTNIIDTKCIDTFVFD